MKWPPLLTTTSRYAFANQSKRLKLADTNAHTRTSSSDTRATRESAIDLTRRKGSVAAVSPVMIRPGILPDDGTQHHTGLLVEQDDSQPEHCQFYSREHYTFQIVTARIDLAQKNACACIRRWHITRLSPAGGSTW